MSIRHKFVFVKCFTAGSVPVLKMFYMVYHLFYVFLVCYLKEKFNGCFSQPFYCPAN